MKYISLILLSIIFIGLMFLFQFHSTEIPPEFVIILSFLNITCFILAVKVTGIKLSQSLIFGVILYVVSLVFLRVATPHSVFERLYVEANSLRGLDNYFWENTAGRVLFSGINERNENHSVINLNSQDKSLNIHDFKKILEQESGRKVEVSYRLPYVDFALRPIGVNVRFINDEE